MANIRWITGTGLLGALILAGCSSHPSDEQIRQQAAQTTEQVKQGAKVAAANAKVAAADAERKLNDVAAGVRQGLKSGDTGARAVDINSASKAKLETLPGITSARAQRIIDGRPYSDPGDLVTRHLLTSAEYRRISQRVEAR